MRHPLCVVAALLLINPPAQAESGSTASYLMNTPPSLLTLGLARLQHHLDGMAEHGPYSWGVGFNGATVGYNPHMDKVLIFLSCSQDRCDPTEKACRDTIEEVRNNAALDHGKVREELKEMGSFYARFFQQAAGTLKPDEDLANRIDQMFLVQVHMSNSGKEVACRAPLLGTDFFVIKD